MTKPQGAVGAGHQKRTTVGSPNGSRNGSPTRSNSKAAARPKSNGASPARAKTAPKKTASQSLAARLRNERDILIGSVIPGGLCDVRSRSVPERVSAEAGQFLDLLIAAVGKSAKGALEAKVRDEVRAGAFAAASPGDVEAIFDAWRRTLQVFAASQGRAVPEDRLLRILDRLESMAVDEARRWMDDRIDVIVIGASAGGIHAIQEMLGALRVDLPATVVIVQHVSSKAPSLLPAVLGRNCEIKVVHAVEGARLFLGHVYVAPPARHLVIREHRLHLSDAPPVRHVKPAADLLFDSAARLYGKHLASVVLSGSDHDGADGTRAVRDGGGMTIAQHPGSAHFPSMPESAIATGSVELVVSLALLGDVLEKLVREGRTAVQERA